MDFFDFHKLVNKRANQSTPKPVPSSSVDETLTVTQLTGQIEKALKAAFPVTVSVKGEISNFKHHGGSGHLYFTLKDSGACIDCVMFKSDAARLKFTPEDGIELVAGGRVAVYAQRGRYQLYVTRLEPIGQGALELAFRQLCAKLQAEGLFDPARKKPLPSYPTRIALVTSTQTAAIQDMLKVLRRYPWVQLFALHVPVQGEGAAGQIGAGILALNRCAQSLGGIDLILLGRGGGSLEDLWAFNEEIVARAIVASQIPIITGVGHEIDVSIADLVADYHAHTPTEAAQVAMAQWKNARDIIDSAGIRLRREIRTLVQQNRQRLNHIERHEVFRRPLDRIHSARQLLDDSEQSLVIAASRMIRLAKDRLNRLAVLLNDHHPRLQVQLTRQRVGTFSRQLDREIQEFLLRQRTRLMAVSTHLNAVSPQRVLERGYSITSLKRGNVLVRSASQLKPNDRIITTFATGSAESVVQDPKQMQLFE
jgi:exodeoxyribonuclease VII large subunit